ncbi:MAG: dipeptide epimerase [Bifidobacteriaceae bacterium]|jgi:L-alanine-DL-glutamate epimerase-like enolase superfamily enzyme|nr:dipeptide epimerase [Bifidobacteriaceae bacterium]
MRVTRITAERVAIRLEKPFVVALGVIDAADTVFVKIDTDAGLTGYGEGVGIGFVTGETSETVLGAVKAFEPAVVGASPWAIDQIHRSMDRILVRNGAAKAAIDIALHDVVAKAAGVPLYEYLGGTRNTVETDMTIGIGEPAAMAAKAAELVGRGYRELKIKAGLDYAADRQAIALIRQAAPDARLKVDANQGWTVPGALAILAWYADQGVESVEQPLPYWDIDGAAYLRSRSPIPIMADESCFTPHDASVIVRRQAADIINIKLMKCGGIYRALQIDAIAEAAGLPTMLGCMQESRLAIAAAAHLVAARPNVADADLDGFAEFDDSAVVRRAFDFDVPIIKLPDTPGLGVDLAF